MYYAIYKEVFFCWKGFVGGAVVSVTFAYVLTMVIKTYLYSSHLDGMLPNDTVTVIKQSPALLARLFDVEELSQMLQIFFSLLSSTVLISCGMGLFALVSCGYIILESFLKKEQVNKSVFFISMVSLLCILGMNFCIALQSTGQVAAGNYKWYTYIRYAKPFWCGAFLTAIYTLAYIKQKRMLYCIFVFSSCICALFINRCLSVVLSDEYGLKYSVFNRIFYNAKNISVKDFFLVFSMVMFWGMWVLMWAYRNEKVSISLLGFICVYVIISGQQTNYYMHANQKNIERTDKTVDIIRHVKLPEHVYYAGDYNRISFCKYLQYALFSKQLKYATGVVQDEVVLCTDINTYDFGDDVLKIEVDADEYFYTSNIEAYHLIINYIEDKNKIEYN